MCTCISCNMTTKDTSNVAIDIPISIIIEDFNIKENKSYKNTENALVYLESASNCIINNVDQLLFCNEYPVVLDKQQKTIYIFDKLGKFFSKIDDIGNGPYEYIQIDDFCTFEKTNSIFVLVVTGSRKSVVYEYNINGRLLNQFKLSFLAKKIATFQDKLVFYTNYSSQLSKGNNIYISDTKCKIISKHFPFNKSKSGWEIDTRVFIKYLDQLYFHPIFCDTIYKFCDSKTIKPHILLKHTNKSNTSQVLDLYLNAPIDQYLDNIGKINYNLFSDILITNDAILFKSENQGKEESYTYSIKKNKLEIFRNGDYISLIKHSPILAHKNYLVSIIYPYEIHEFIDRLKASLSSEEWSKYEKNNNLLITLYTNSSMNDNPIIFMYN